MQQCPTAMSYRQYDLFVATRVVLTAIRRVIDSFLFYSFIFCVCVCVCVCVCQDKDFVIFVKFYTFCCRKFYNLLEIENL